MHINESEDAWDNRQQIEYINSTHTYQYDPVCITTNIYPCESNLAE